MQKKVRIPISFSYHFLFILFCCQWMGSILTDDQHHWSGPAAPKSNPAKTCKN